MKINFLHEKRGYFLVQGLSFSQVFSYGGNMFCEKKYLITIPCALNDNSIHGLEVPQCFIQTTVESDIIQSTADSEVHSDTDTRHAISDWSLDEKYRLLMHALSKVNTKPLRALEKKVKWEQIIKGKSSQQCKLVFKHLLGKVIGPKRPPTAFAFFVKKNSKNYNGQTMKTRLRLLGEEWGKLSELQKVPYNEEHVTAKRKYLAQLATFKANKNGL
jgi:hypothetical protein